MYNNKNAIGGLRFFLSALEKSYFTRYFSSTLTQVREPLCSASASLNFSLK